MRLRILGCHGGESPTHRTSCFLIDDNLLLDAGALTRGLTVPEQARIDYIFLSHSHLDHIQDLALLVDNVIGQRQKPVEVYCSDTTADTLAQHFFNDKIWPDFTKFPNPSDPEKPPTIRINRTATGQVVEVGAYKVHTVDVTHSIDCRAHFVTGKSGTVVYSGDTGPTEKLWEELANTPKLRAFIYEVSFPNKMQKLAEISGHLTPEMVQKELEKYRPQTNAPVLLYHMKPGFHDVLKDEIAALGDPRIVMLKPMEEYEY